MDSCRNCTICFNMCPTKAIIEESHLIRTDRCLIFFNEDGGYFPDWIDPKAHNSICISTISAVRFIYFILNSYW